MECPKCRFDNLSCDFQQLMARFLLVLAFLLLTVVVSAQIKAGTIYGKIVDAKRNPPPGITVTLNGPQMAQLTTAMNKAGMYRFPQVPPAMNM